MTAHTGTATAAAAAGGLFSLSDDLNTQLKIAEVTFCSHLLLLLLPWLAPFNNKLQLVNQ